MHVDVTCTTLIPLPLHRESFGNVVQASLQLKPSCLSLLSTDAIKGACFFCCPFLFAKLYLYVKYKSFEEEKLACKTKNLVFTTNLVFCLFYFETRCLIAQAGSLLLMWLRMALSSVWLNPSVAMIPDSQLLTYHANMGGSDQCRAELAMQTDL